MAGGVRIGVAFDDATLEPSPTWTYLTDTDQLVAGYTINRGRQFEFDKTDTGTATVTVYDQDGVLDPTLSTGPYYNKLEPLLQIIIDLWNPVASEYQTRYRGFIEDFNYGIDPSQQVTRLEMSCVDLFEILTAIEMQPGQFGDTPPAAAAGYVFFDNATVQDRITQVLGDAGVPTAFYVVFTGNVYCSESTYSPSENVLQVIQDAADAEFPTVSNVYCDRLGRLCFHGRLAKFDPEGTASGASPGAWDLNGGSPFTPWNVGDGAAVAASITDTAQIRTLSFNRGLSKVFNSAFCTPNGFDQRVDDITAQLKEDLPSIGTFGIRSWSAENLLIAAPTGDALHATGASILTGNNALDECALYADFVKSNYAEPRNRITEITFRSLQPTDSRAVAVWAFLSKCDIADQVSVTETSPGGGGFTAEPFFIEGIREDAKPLNGSYADVTVSLDLSPQPYFAPGPWSGDT
jgi:hypothetical protein